MNPTAFLTLAVLCLSQFTSVAEVRLASLFQDGMVLQREMAVPVWGSAKAGEEVTVSFAGQTKSAKADQDGRWRLELESLVGSAEGREMKITGENEIVLKDVLVGEVWVCSGQSNMQMGVGGVPEVKALIPKAKQLADFRSEADGCIQGAG